MNKLSDHLEQILKSKDEFCLNESECKKYTDALALYNRLIEKGLITPRGNRLIDIEERVKGSVRYNVPAPKAS